MIRFLLFLTFYALPLVPFAQSPVPTDAALKNALVGVWCNSDDGGKTCWGFDEFREDGTVSSCSLPPGATQAWRGSATYEVKGVYSCLIVTDSSDATMRPGERICAQVLEINSVLQRYKYTDASAEFTLYRRRPQEMRCPGVGV